MNSAARQEVFTSYLNLLHHMRTPAQDVGTIQVFTDGFEVDSLPAGMRTISGFFQAARKAIVADMELLTDAANRIKANGWKLHNESGPIGQEDGVTIAAIWSQLADTDTDSRDAGLEGYANARAYESLLRAGLDDLDAICSLAARLGHLNLSIETED